MLYHYKAWFNRLVELEPYLIQLQVQPPSGIYTKQSIQPIILPSTRKDYLVTIQNKNQQPTTLYLNYQQLVEAIPKLNLCHGCIENDYGELITRDLKELSLQPYFPVRSLILISTILDTLIHETRAFNKPYDSIVDRPYMPLDLLLEEPIEETIRTYSQDYDNILNHSLSLQIIDDLIMILDDDIRPLYEQLLKDRWLLLSTTFDLDQSFIETSGDYRIHEWMREHKRYDY